MLVAPAIITLVLVNIFPLLWSFGLSFFQYKANRVAPPVFKGLDNYADVLTDPEIWARFQNTAVIVIGSVTLQLIVGFLLALLFAQEFPLRRYLLMLVLSPMMLSLSAVGVFFKLFYDPTLGFISRFISMFTTDTFVILSTPVKATIAVVFADAWMWSPFVMLLVLAGLVSVPKYLYEAAEIDRVSRWRRFTTITFPYIKQPADAGAAVPHHRNLQAVRRHLFAHRGRPGLVDRDGFRLCVPPGLPVLPDQLASALGYILLFAVIVLTSLYL